MSQCKCDTCIDLKQGDTLDLACEFQEDRVAVDLTGWTVRAWVRQGGRLVEQLTVTVTDAPAGKYSLAAAPAQTRKWPIGLLDVDIEYTTQLGRVMHTQTFQVRIHPTVTL